MKKFILFSIFFLLLVIVYFSQSGCSNSVTNPSSTNSGISFTLSNQISGDTCWFLAKPSQNIYLDSLIATCTSINVTELLIGNPNQILDSSINYKVYYFIGAQSGQKWDLTFRGRLVNGNSKFSKSQSITLQIQSPGVTFTMSTTTGNEGTIFLAKPNVNVKIDSAVCKLPAQNFSSTTVNADTSQVFNANENINIGEFIGVQSGQAWTFSIYGRRADNNLRYTANSNYTVP